jgi:hypothetical protein
MARGPLAGHHVELPEDDGLPKRPWQTSGTGKARRSIAAPATIAQPPAAAGLGTPGRWAR